MPKKIVVHTGAKPGTPLEAERRALNAPDIELILRGRCSTPEQVLAAVQEADLALCYAEPYTQHVFANAARLKAVIRYGVGVDTVDLDAATEHGVMIANFPDFCVREVADHALALVLACAKKLLPLDRTLRGHGWEPSRALRSPMGTIHDQTLGLLAFGNIARTLAARARALEMRVIAYDPYVDSAVFTEAGVEGTSLERVAAESDYISCHLPLTDQTRGVLDAAFFDRMKPTAYFINTSRGAVVKEADLIDALREGRIAGAGLDVFESEPIGPEHALCQMENVVLTPHLASFADATFVSLYRRVGETALDILRGDIPAFVANPKVLTHRRT